MTIVLWARIKADPIDPDALHAIGNSTMTYRRLKLVLVGTTSLLILATAWPMTGIVSAAEPAKRTFLVQGLHCPPCTRTVEASLKSLKGVGRHSSSSWNSKNAWITFDESVVSAQQIAGSIAATPHMMGADALSSVVGVEGARIEGRLRG